MKVSLIGDYNAAVTAHRVIPKAIRLAADALRLDVEYEWVGSTRIDVAALVAADAIWCVPASPYRDPAAVLGAIRVARENNIPFLGTCGGYQHAVLEFAHHVLGYPEAGNTEEHPETEMPLISALSCRLDGDSAAVNLEAGTRLAAIYDKSRIHEEYNCGFGVNRDYLPLFETSDLRFSAFDDTGDPRALEVDGLRFFIGTAFQPERAALQGRVHPLIKAFLATGI